MTAISLKDVQARTVETVKERLSQESYDEIFGPFDRGEFRELTEQEWQALMDGQRMSPHNPRSLALPQGAGPGEAPPDS